jgi:tetratricopeptide (TPR) repeat protein
MWSEYVLRALQTWKERRRALREIKDLQQVEEFGLALDDSNLVNRSKMALAAGAPVEALQFWQEALTRYPKFAMASRDSLGILLGLRRFDEAESLMLLGQKRSTRDHFFLDGYAMVAEQRGNTDEAIERWERVRRKFPGHWTGYVHGGACLSRAGQLAAAEALINKGVRLFPDNAQAWTEAARIAEHRHDWQEAIRRWEIVREKFRDVRGDIGLARGLEKLGRIEEAEDHLKTAQLRAHQVHEIAPALARLANLRGDKEEAARRWADVRRRFPRLSVGYQEGFRHLMQMGRCTDAEAILLAAVDCLPSEQWPAVEYASLAHRGEDWSAAAARWAAVRAGWPNREDGYLRGAEALAAIGREDEAARLRAEYQLRTARQAPTPRAS